MLEEPSLIDTEFAIKFGGSRGIDRADWMNKCHNIAKGLLEALGAKGHLPSGYIVSLLWVLKQFARQIPTGQIMGSFKKYPPQYPVGTL